MIALQRNEPHWILNDADATRYGTALANVMRHFPVRASQKAVDFAALMFAAAQFDMPRIALSMQAMKQQAQQAQQPRGPGVVMAFTPRPHSPASPSHPNATAQAAGGSQGAPPIADPPMDGDGMGGDAFVP